MNSEQIKIVNMLADSNIITLNGVVAEAYPYDGGVLINNNPFEEGVKWEQAQVSYQEFIETVENNGGTFNI